jgi:hypothetical protein
MDIHILLQIKPHNFKMRMEQQTLFNMPCSKMLYTKIISATTLCKLSILQQIYQYIIYTSTDTGSFTK